MTAGDADQISGQAPSPATASPRSPPASPIVVKRKPVPPRLQTSSATGSLPAAPTSPTANKTATLVSGTTPSPPSASSKPTASIMGDTNAAQLSSPRPSSAHGHILTTPLASPPPALRGGHTARAPEHTGPSTGTITSTSGAPSTTSSAKHPSALSSGQVRRGGHERNSSTDSAKGLHNLIFPATGRATPGELSGRGTPGDFFTPGTQTPDPEAWYTPPRSAASSVHNFNDVPVPTTPISGSRPGSTLGPSTPASSSAASEAMPGGSPGRFAFPGSKNGPPPSSLSRHAIKSAGVGRSQSLGHGFHRPRQSSGSGPMPTVQEGLNRARSQGHTRRHSQYEEPVDPNLMSIIGFDSAYPAPALNAQSPFKRFGSVHGGSVLPSHPSSATGSSDQLDSPFTTDLHPQPGSQKVSSSGSVRNSYGVDDSAVSGYSSPIRSSLNSSGQVHKHSHNSLTSSSNGSSSTKYTPITRDGTGKMGFRDIIDIATMSPLAFDRLDEVESDDDLHDPEKLEDTLHRNNSVRSWRTGRKTGGNKYRRAVQEKEERAEKDHVTGPPPSKKVETERVGIRAFLNVGSMLIITLGVLMLFAGYPIYSHYKMYKYHKFGAYQIGGTNGSGQVGQVPGIRTTLIDPDTPQDAYTRTGQDGVTQYNLVFSDEFNTPGRSFYPGDDPFWEAVNLHYWQTNNFEWYDPAGVTTRDGALSITLSQHPDHDLNFRGGMIQSWNKFCFTGGIIVVSVRLPGQARVGGLWPAIWMMGNLGRAGYGASLEGTWPYTYDTCDTGTLANQTDPATGLPNSTTLGDCGFNSQFGTKALSFLPGQKLSSCTCPGEDHPGPRLKNGQYKGRAAPELDIFEAQVSDTEGMTVSQSLQLAPFNAYYKLSQPAELYSNRSWINSYTGERTQQAASGITPTDQTALQYLRNGSSGGFSEYGVEYEPGNDGFIKWSADGQPAWVVNSTQLQPDPLSGIARRPVPEEPLYIIMNLGMSSNFGSVSWDKLKWPNQMDIDWVRVYQHGEPRIGCDPDDYPTRDYINRHIEAYTNSNFTLWGNTREEGGYGAAWPRNRLYPGGCNAPASTYPGSPLKKIPQAQSFEGWQVGEDKALCAVPNSS